MTADPEEINMALVTRTMSRSDLEVAAAEAKTKAQLRAALASEQVIDALWQAFQLGPSEAFDVNAWIRIGEILLSRSIPKVAAKHAESDGDVIESADTVALRDSILEIIQKAKS